MEELLTQQEVEEILKVSKNTMERWRRQGGGPNFIRIGQGRAVRYKTEDLNVYLNNTEK
jgi:predicted site-specific integrase-resolvase